MTTLSPVGWGGAGFLRLESACLRDGGSERRIHSAASGMGGSAHARGGVRP